MPIDGTPNMPVPVRRLPIDLGRRLGSPVTAWATFAPLFAGSTSEYCLILYLDIAHRTLGMFAIDGVSEGSIDLSLRLIIREALANNARAFILAHNHPDGDPTPSIADKMATRLIAEVAGPLNLELLDHLIFGGDDVTSFRELGLL